MKPLRILPLALFLLPSTAFLVPSTTSCSTTRLNAERQDTASRADVLKVAFGLGSLIMGGAQISSAAVPTMDEYYVGSGTVIRPNKATDSPAPAPAPAAGPGLVPPPSQIILEAQNELDDIEKLVDKQSWANVVEALRKPPLSLVRSRFFGRRSLGELAGTLPMPSTARGIEDVREEAAVALTSLLDFSFSNRVIYFNNADKAAVEALALASAATSSLDLDEPKSALREARIYLKKLEVMV